MGSIEGSFSANYNQKYQRIDLESFHYCSSKNCSHKKLLILFVDVNQTWTCGNSALRENRKRNGQIGSKQNRWCEDEEFSEI